MRLETKRFSLLIQLLLVLCLVRVAAFTAFRRSPCMFLARSTTRQASFFISKAKRNMSLHNSANNRLLEMAESLIAENTKLDTNGKHRVCLVVAGGGGQAISALSSTPGASSLLLEGTVTYDHNSFWTYIGESSEQEESLVSEKMAQRLSRAALDRALTYVSSDIGSYSNCVGVACTSALLKPSGRVDRTSRGNICATTIQGEEWKCSVTLAQSSGRTRQEEDYVMSCLALESLQQLLFSSNNNMDYLQGGDDVHVTVNAPQQEEIKVVASAQHILSGQTTSVLLVPREEQESYAQVPRVVLPRHKPTLIFPGSFNPPHEGHLALAQAAASTLKEANTNILFEMSLTNPDKPSMEPKEVSRRAHLFFQKRELLPKNWGILLTSAPLFQQKVQLLRQAGNKGQLVFVIGTDTMVRIIDRKYYDDSQEKMLEAVREMKQLGVKYVVGGRTEQGKVGGKFVTGQEELLSLPPDVQEIFRLVREEDFRMDISSTELRKRAQASFTS